MLRPQAERLCLEEGAEGLEKVRLEDWAREKAAPSSKAAAAADLEEARSEGRARETATSLSTAAEGAAGGKLAVGTGAGEAASLGSLPQRDRDASSSPAAEAGYREKRHAGCRKAAERAAEQASGHREQRHAGCRMAAEQAEAPMVGQAAARWAAPAEPHREARTCGEHIQEWWKA